MFVRLAVASSQTVLIGSTPPCTSSSRVSTRNSELIGAEGEGQCKQHSLYHRRVRRFSLGNYFRRRKKVMLFPKSVCLSVRPFICPLDYYERILAKFCTVVWARK